ncbi:MAG: hypothetical protein RMK91_03425 [Pseudanabaenaceae cyanobacterium SKYGB_i_bin29]|nr:hypothetical protein [Pseudanabaenaceae cyanobacterium SKYG29]MDW8420895.1 hypothetical protein [Pseudanabaenaceae cyanobacterium SKYGB_i_bin29]
MKDDSRPWLLDLEKYAKKSSDDSSSAAEREVRTEHNLEKVQAGTAKGLLEIRDCSRGVYYLTADEIIFGNGDEVIIQESKNTTKSYILAWDDIKDGLFKLLLYSQLQELQIEKRSLTHCARLRLTGKFSGSLTLPNDDAVIRTFASSAGLRSKSITKLMWLNEELRLLNIKGIVEGTNA